MIEPIYTDRIAEFWDAYARLTYSEAIEVATQLRDAALYGGIDVDNGYDWAKVIALAHTTYVEEPTHD